MKKYIPKVEPIPITKDGHDKLIQEMADLTAERPEALLNLQKSRELGDLKENGYYQASRQKMNEIDGRLRRIKFMLRYALIVEGTDTSSVDIGTTVLLREGTKEFSYQIVGVEEANPREEKISFRSPLGHALLGKKIGDTVVFHAPSGERVYTVVKLS
jgi:transcription elongation factor GreA